MISNVSFSFDLTYTNPVTGALQPRCIVTDSTDYIGLGLDPVDYQLKGLGQITFNGDIIEDDNTVLDPMIDLEAWDFNTGVPTRIYNLPLDLNGNVANGVYTFLYRLRVNVQTADPLPITLTPTDLVTFPNNEWVSQFLEIGNTITLIEPFVDNENVTVEATAQVDADAEITVSDYTIAGANIAIFELINVQSSEIYTYSGCTQTTADVSFTYDCEYGDSGTWGVSNTTKLASNEVITSLSCAINYPSWTTLSPIFPGNIVTNSLPYPPAGIENPLATGTYSVSLTQQIQQTQTDGLAIIYSTSVIKEFNVSCAGSLCGLTPCIESLRVAHQAELVRNRVSKYQVYVDNVLLYYAEAQNYRSCGEIDKYRATLELIKQNLDSSGCECACCDENTYYWVSNNSGDSVINNLLRAFQFRLFTLDPPGPGSPTADDDETQGVEVGALWQNVTTGIIYRCTVNTATLAEWEEYYAPGVTPDAIDIPAVPGPILTGPNVQAQLDQVQTLFLFDGINGLSKLGTDVGLGGTLDTDTTINVNGNDFIIESDDATLEVIATAGIPLLLNVNQAGTGVGINALLTTTNSAGAGANGMGSSIQFAAENAAGTPSLMSTIRTTWANATTGSSNFQITTKEANVENPTLTLGFNGLVAFNAYGVGDFNLSTPEYSLAVDANGSVIEVPAVFTYAGRTRLSGGAIQISEFGNTTGATISISNSGVGVYTITASSAIFTTNTVAFVQLQGGAGFTTAVVATSSTITISTYSVAGVLDDAVITAGSFIKIEIYS